MKLPALVACQFLPSCPRELAACPFEQVGQLGLPHQNPGFDTHTHTHGPFTLVQRTFSAPFWDQRCWTPGSLTSPEEKAEIQLLTHSAGRITRILADPALGCQSRTSSHPTKGPMLMVTQRDTACPAPVTTWEGNTEYRVDTHILQISNSPFRHVPQRNFS